MGGEQGRDGTPRLILQLSLIHAIYVCVSQWAMATECFQLGYNAEGHCKGEADPSIPEPQKLNWEIPPEVSRTIDECLERVREKECKETTAHEE